jgi:hypothetical protein
LSLNHPEVWILWIKYWLIEKRLSVDAKKREKSCELLCANEFCETGCCSYKSGLSFGKNRRGIPWKTSDSNSKTCTNIQTWAFIQNLVSYWEYIGLEHQNNNVQAATTVFMLIMFPFLFNIRKELFQDIFAHKIVTFSW